MRKLLAGLFAAGAIFPSALVATVAGEASDPSARAAAADPPSASAVVATPFILDGDLHTERFFFGRISVAADLDDPSSGAGSVAEVSLDGGVTFAPAIIENSSPISRVNTVLPREQVTPVIAALDGGGSVVSWAGAFDGGGAGISAQRYDAAGAPLGGELQVNTHTPGDQTQPAVAALGDGGFVIAWTSFNEDGSSFAVIAQRYDAAGARVGAAFRVNDHTANAQLRPAVAGLDDGGFVIAWQSLAQAHPAAGYRIYAKRYDAAGAVVSPAAGCVAGNCEFRVDNRESGDQTDPSAAATSNGGFVITWTGERSGEEGDDEIYGALYAADGTVVQQTFLLRGVEASPRQGQRTTAVASWGEGGFAAVWVNQSTDTGLDVFLQAFTAEGAGVIDGGARALRVNLDAAGNQSAPSIAALGDGGLIVSWTDGSVTPRPIRARRYDSALAPVGDELTIASSADGNAASSAVAALPARGFIATWEATGNPADSGGGIFLRRMTGARLVRRDLTPARDIELQFRLSDPARPGEVWTSPIRRYRYSDPDEGRDGQVVYPDGFTSASSVDVGLILPAIPNGYSGVQLQQRQAALVAGQCVDYEGWVNVGAQSHDVRVVEVELSDARCNQFRWLVINNLNVIFTHSSGHVLGVDRLVPLVIATHQRVGNLLRVNVQVIEPGSGVASQAYVSNRGQPVPFSSNEALVPLTDGANSVRIDVVDRAGNRGTAGFFVSADLRPPAIDIVSIEEGQTYGGELSLLYTLTRPLTQLVILVDGVAIDPAELSDLADGPHQLVIRGLDEQGNLVEKTVNFTVDRARLSVSLLSPQARRYTEDAIAISFRANRPLTASSVTLDDAPVTESVLRGLSDGEHTLTLQVTAEDGATQTITRTFTVEASAPTLEVSAPRDGQTLLSRSLELVFETNSPVEYQIGEVRGEAVSGTVLPLPSDGPQQITLTATHPGGAVVSRTINVTVDSLSPSLTILSPAPQLYAARTIPIDFRANKPMRSVVIKLDGAEVNALEELGDGAHQLEITATDLTGRAVRRLIPFQVAHLEIVSPLPDQHVIDSRIPPGVTLQWAAGGNFTSLTASIDGGMEQLLPSNATSASLSLPGGTHEVVVRGRLGDQVLARSVRFTVGARNVRVNQNAIKYVSSSCDDALECDVQVTLQVENVGDYDLVGPIPVIFEVVAPSGELRSFEWIVAGIAAGERRTATLSTFRARIEDLFRVSIDPQRTLPAEDVRDNVQELRFQPGKILQVETSLSASNFYLSGARTDNLYAVATAGPVAYVEMQAGDLFFRDATGAQGFVAAVDMGLLSPEQNYVRIKAYDAANRLLDARIQYVEVRGLDSSYPVSADSSPWRSFLGAGNRVFVDQIDQRALARAELLALRTSFSDGAITAYRIDAGTDAVGKLKIDYGMTHSDAPSLARSGQLPAGVAGGASPQETSIDTKAVGSFTRLSLLDGACQVAGYAPITSSADHRRTIVESLDAFASEVEGDINQRLEPLLESTIGEVFNDLGVSILPIDDRLGLSLISRGFTGGWVAGLLLVAPNNTNQRFQLAGPLEDLVFEGSTSCQLRLVGPRLVIDSSVTFDMAFRRRIALDTAIAGLFLGYWSGEQRLPVPQIPVFARLALGVFAVRGPSFEGSITVDLHFRGGLRGALPSPSLTIDESDMFLGVRVPWQNQKVAVANILGFLTLPFAWALAAAEVTVYTEVQAETMLDSHLTEPIVLSNPSFLLGDLPDTDASLEAEAHVFAKAHVLTTINGGACVLMFICLPFSTSMTVTLEDQCLTLEDRELVPGIPGVDCPLRVPNLPFPPR